MVPWDFKLGPRTMLVAPGTVRFDATGSLIGRYVASPWTAPPVLDPRDLAPGLEIYRDLTPFVRDQRPKRDRVMAAMTYLRLHAPVCRGKGARKVLWEVAVHLVSYYDLDPHLVLHLMTTDKGGHVAWNNRCLDEHGTPFPWDPSELLEVIQGVQDDPPPYGIAEHRRLAEREFHQWCLSTFVTILNLLPRESADRTIATRDLYRFFLGFSGTDPRSIVLDEFGAEIHKAIASGRLTTLIPYRTASARGFKGADLESLYYACDLYEGRADALPDWILEACDF